MQEHFCRLQPSLGHVPLSARYSIYRSRVSYLFLLQCLRSSTSVVIVLIVNSPLQPRFVIRSPLFLTTTHLSPPPTHPPSSSIRLPPDPSTPPSPSISPVDARPSFFSPA